jgi:hypothetical protein
MAKIYQRTDSTWTESSALSSIPSSVSDYSNVSDFIKRKPRPFHTANTTPATDSVLATSNSAITTSPNPQPPKPPQCRYRRATEAPESFKQQTQILFEEGIYHLAIQSLQTNLFANAYHPASTPYWVAPPSHLAFLATLLIHPANTSWAKTDAARAVVVRAHAYLLDALRAVGPVNGRFKTAFAFRDRSARREGRRRRHSPDESSDGDDEDRLETPLANEEGVWNRVGDFWTMLGWAFSCAAHHPDRWGHWKIWVELLLEVLERDFEERKALDEDRGDGKLLMLKESMIVGYIEDLQLGHVLRVLFAFVDGGEHSYQEVWPRETQIPAANKKRKRDTKVDLEKDQYGDWLDGDDLPNDSDFDSDPLSPKKARPKRKAAAGTGRRKKQLLPLVAHPLLEETIPIRRRLFALISKTCFHLHDVGAVPFSLDNLYERVAQNVAALPLDVFPHFVWSDMPVLDSIYVTLARNLLANELLPPNPVQPADVDPATDAKGFVSGVILERCFLPYACNSVIGDNARMAVVLWELFSFLWRIGEVGPVLGRGMREAMRVGMKERERKSKIQADVPPKGKGVGGKWLERVMAEIAEDPHVPRNVLRLAHLKFRLVLEKAEEADECIEEDLLLGGGFLGWK